MPGSASVLAKKFDKGAFVLIQAELSFEQVAKLAQQLMKAENLAAINKAVAAGTAESSAK
jgi:hypothetical protein